MRNKNYLFLFLFLFCFVLLLSCSKKDVTAEPEYISLIKEDINKNCTLSDSTSVDKDTVLARLYFNNNSYNLTAADREILAKIVRLYKKCGNKLLVIGNSSNFEYNKSHLESYKIAFNRTINVYNYLSKEVNTGNIYYINCNNLKNQYVENNKVAQRGNQRVDIVMLSKSFSNKYLYCF